MHHHIGANAVGHAGIKEADLRRFTEQVNRDEVKTQAASWGDSRSNHPLRRSLWQTSSRNSH